MSSKTTTPHLHDILYQYFYFIPFATLLSYILYQRFFSPLSSIPGPFLASLTRWWLVYITRLGHYNRTLLHLHNKYGSLVRIAPDEVSVVDLDGFRTIYGSASKFRKSDWYSVWQGHRVFDVFGERDVKKHAQQRKLVTRAFAMETLKELEGYVDNMVEVFVTKMGEQIGKKVDMAYWIQLFTFDVIGEITWSKSFGYMESSSDQGTFSKIHDVVSSGTWIGQVPWVFWLHDRLQPYIGNYLSINHRHSGLRNFALCETEARKDKPVKKKDMIGRYFDTMLQKPDEFDFNAVISMGTTNINAGADTTAVSMRAVIYHLLRNPEAKYKLIEEIDDMRRKGELSYPVKWDEANKMKYLQACIYEGMRIHPAIGINLPRVVPQGGVQINGHYIPENTIVGTSAWVLHQNKSVYGEDVDKFKPEIWLQEDTGDMHRFFFSFGGGSRACMGRNISWLEISKLIPTLFLRFDVELWEGKEWTEECLFFVYQSDFYVKLTPRKDPAEEA
ncbi:cytochrome P450 [Lojkania enalia]|uniref:Cytochrome P450 n=1 Tax=Lojkania enalia TaxID=147567 RepID=A0A9P4N661_9PLEO|nr:cytochrome P450 [Didymosphaeria enalia]